MYPFRITIAANQMILGENDNLAALAEEVFAPSKTALFLPVVVIAAGYALLLGWIWIAGDISSGIARLAIIVLIAGVPLLLAHAILRYLSTGIRLFDEFAKLNPGFPRYGSREILYSDIADIELNPSILPTKSGTVTIRLISGEKLAVCDLDHPQFVREAFNRRMEAHAQRHDDFDKVQETPAFAAQNRQAGVGTN